MSDSLWNSWHLRTYSVVDDCNRYGLGIEIDISLPAQRVVQVIERISEHRGYPKQIQLDNGPDIISAILAEWAESHGITFSFIKPGRPTQNGFVEGFNRTYREGVLLDSYIFESLNQA